MSDKFLRLGLKGVCSVLSLCLLAGCAAQRATSIGISGIGADTCTQWTSEHAAKSAQAVAQDKWMFDFFRTNKLRVEAKDSWPEGVYSEFYIVWATGLTCKEHPRWTIHELAERFVKGAEQTKLEAVT
jgi:hypothetical protein